jgi:DNA replication protein DnaC
MIRVSTFKTAPLATTIQQAKRERSLGNMTAFLKIDGCKVCHRQLPWEWVPAIILRAQPMAGTGVWRSQLVEGQCAACLAATEAKHQNDQRAAFRRKKVITLLGGEKPYREFTFERFNVTPDNQLAYERFRDFNPAGENLYLWGACGVGKTHLACAAARRCVEETLSVEILRIGQLSRQVRMKEPDQEQAAIDQLIGTDVLVLDDLGTGPNTPYYQQVLQEVLDGRYFTDRSGLVITSKYSLGALAAKLGEDTIPSRLAGLCSVIRIRGADRRLTIQ